MIQVRNSFAGSSHGALSGAFRRLLGLMMPKPVQPLAQGPVVPVRFTACLRHAVG